MLKKEEGPKLDFKATLSLKTDGEKKELTKDIIAMANAMGGRGYIIFGVEDKTKNVIGIRSNNFNEEKIQQVIYNRCDPPVPISVDFVKYNNKLVAVLTIYRSNQKPHQMIQTGSFYIRRGSTTDIVRRSELANMFQENGLLTYETVMLKNVNINELRFDLIRKFFKSLNVVSDNPSEILLEAMGIVGRGANYEKFHPTIGGLLLFGKNPSMFLPHVYIRVAYNDEAECFTGNVLEMMDKAITYVEKKINDKEYPIEAIKEGIANAIVHRDYLDVSQGITIRITNRIIEITNPGALIATDSVYKYKKDSNSLRRNAWLYQRLLTFDHKKRFLKTGIGLKRIRKAFESFGEVKFVNVGSQNLFKVIFPRHKQKS